jgi:LPXTG-motif cell wall-anchored protein
VPPVEAPAAGFGVSPLLLALVAVAAGVGLYFLLKKKNSNSPG